MITFTIPIEVVSEMNKREHWAVVAKRKKNQRYLAGAYLRKFKKFDGTGEYEITLTRIKGYRQRNFDSDNLQSAFKAVRDGISDALKIDDKSERLNWEYVQEKGDRAGVRVEVMEKVCS